ncbi:MAG: nitroreductase family protein [Caldicoprobacterales bacterium]|jgi:nitroreductase|nr:nitroreductase [Clostridiales bacterium]
MSFLELARQRYSVRSYKNISVEKDKIIKVLEAGRVSPSACNFQPRYFIVIDDSELKEKIAECYPREWFKQAPVIIVVCGNHKESWKRQDDKDHCDIDVAIAIDHMTLAAADQGLGTCWICAFDAKLCHEILELPEHMEVVALLPLGYPEMKGDAKRHSKARKSLDEIVGWNRYKESDNV